MNQRHDKLAEYAARGTPSSSQAAIGTVLIANPLHILKAMIGGNSSGTNYTNGEQAKPKKD